MPKSPNPRGAVEVGRRLRELRLAKGKTLAQLADDTDSDKGTLSAYENGHHTPHVESLRRIARALDVGIEELIGP